MNDYIRFLSKQKTPVQTPVIGQKTLLAEATLSIILFFVFEMLCYFVVSYKTPGENLGFIFFAALHVNIMIAFSMLIISSFFGLLIVLLSAFFLLFIFSNNLLPMGLFLILSYFATWAACLLHKKRRKSLFIRQELENDNLQEDYNMLFDSYSKKKELTPTLRQKLKKFVVITEATETLGNSLEIEKTLNLAADVTLFIIDKGLHCLIFTYNHIEDTLELQASASKQISRERIKQKTGNVFDKWVLKNKQALIIQNTSKDFRFGNLHGDNDNKNIKSLISAPLLHKSNLIGIIRLDSPNANTFVSDDLRMLDILAHITALVVQNILLYHKTLELAIHDSLTRLFVHRHFHKRLDAELTRASITNTSLSLILLDIDHFKNYNDTHGHPAGDRVLYQIARLLEENVPMESIVGRYGGEEFAVILPRTTANEAFQIAEKLREAAENTLFAIRRMKTKCTISLGIASYPDHAQNKIELIGKADKALYKAKNEGRNRSCIFTS